MLRNFKVMRLLHFIRNDKKRVSLRGQSPWQSNFKRHNIYAFSLIEALTIILILGAVTLLLMPGMGAFIEYAKLRRYTWEIVSDLRERQQKAVISHINRQVAFYSDRDEYGVDGIIKKVEVDVVSFDGQPTAPITGTRIIFWPNGTTTEDPPITGVSGSNILMKNSAGDRLTIKVNSTTGHVRVE